MKFAHRTLIVLFLLLCARSTSAGLFIGNMDVGPGVLRIQWEHNPDGTYTSWVDINPNIGEDVLTSMELTITGELFQSILTDPTAITLNDGDTNVNFTSDATIAELFDTNYDIAKDTVIDDTLWPGVLGLDLTPADGTQEMHLVLNSQFGLIGGPIPGNSFFPLAHVTTQNDEINIFGTLSTFDYPVNVFSVSLVLPEPSALLIATIGSTWLLLVRVPRSVQNLRPVPCKN